MLRDRTQSRKQPCLRQLQFNEKAYFPIIVNHQSDAIGDAQ